MCLQMVCPKLCQNGVGITVREGDRERVCSIAAAVAGSVVDALRSR